jgi:hypothetical protein
MIQIPVIKTTDHSQLCQRLVVLMMSELRRVPLDVKTEDQLVRLPKRASLREERCRVITN